MSDVVKAACDYRRKLRAEIAKLDEFLALAKKISEMAETTVRTSPIEVGTKAPVGKETTLELTPPTGKVITEKLPASEPTIRANGHGSLFRGAIGDPASKPEAAAS